MNYLTPIIVAIIAASPAWFGSLLDLLKTVRGKETKQTELLSLLKKINNDNTVLKNAVGVLVKSSLTKQMVDCINAGCVTVEEIDNVKTLYEPYHALGFNGTLDNLYEKFCKLELKKGKN